MKTQRLILSRKGSLQKLSPHLPLVHTLHRPSGRHAIGSFADVALCIDVHQTR